MDGEYGNNGSEWEEGDAEEILIVTSTDHHHNNGPQQPNRRHSMEELARSDLRRTAMDFAEQVRAVPGARAGAAAPGTGEVERLTAQECRVAGVSPVLRTTKPPIERPATARLSRFGRVR